MANEIEQANFVVLQNAISAAMSPAFVNRSIFLSIIYTETYSTDSKVHSFRKSGSLSAQILAESTNYTVDANSELTDSKVDATAEKAAMSTEHSVESLRFGTSAAQPERFVREHADAHGRLFDDQCKTLISSVTNGVTATSTANKDLFLDGRYNVVSSMKGAFSGNLVAVVDYKAANELAKELTDTGATAFTQGIPLGILGTPQANGFLGSLMGVSIYQTDGLPTDSGNDVGVIFDPAYGMAAAVDGINGFRTEIHRPELRTGGVLTLDTYTFYKVVLWNDTACCRLLSSATA